MVQEFYINANSTLPHLRMELIRDGRHDFHKIYEALQDADVTFTMRDSETDILKISNAPADVLLDEDSGCEERYILQYKWQERDTKKKGIFEGCFTIKFRGDVAIEKETLIVPIQEKLLIYVV